MRPHNSTLSSQHVKATGLRIQVQRPRKWYRPKWKTLVYWSLLYITLHTLTLADGPFFHPRAGGSCSQWYKGVVGILSTVRNYATLFLFTTQHFASYSNLYLYILLVLLLLFFCKANTVYPPLCSERLSVRMFCMGISCMMPLLSQIPNILALY